MQFLLVAVTVLALGAGLTAGLLSARLPNAHPGVPDPNVERTLLVEQLDLTPDQQAKMKQIWEATRSEALRAYDEAQKLQKTRDDRIFSLLNDEQKAQFAQLSKEFKDRYDELQLKRDKAFSEAVKQTRALLNETQQQKYDQILRTHVGTAALDRSPLNFGTMESH